VDQVDSHGRWKGPCLQTNTQCDPVSQHHLHHVDESTPTALSLITRFFNGNTVRNFPTHGQLSAAQGSLTSCLNFDFAILNLFEPSAL
jgi:hypothetical protein